MYTSSFSQKLRNIKVKNPLVHKTSNVSQKTIGRGEIRFLLQLLHQNNKGT